MIYIDENGNTIESYDLKLGYLVNHEWVDHPAVEQSGHYEYDERNVQTFVIDSPAVSAWREVTVKKFVPYTEVELMHMEKLNYAARLDMLEIVDKEHDYANEEQNAQILTQAEKIIEQEVEINNLKIALEEAQTTNDMLTECILEMSAVVYA